MRNIPLYLPFSLALAMTLFGNIFFPFFPLHTFAPFLAITYHRATLSKALWISAGCGLILDLLSSEFKFGLYTLNLVATTLLIYSQKKHFFEDKPVALSLFTTLIAAVSIFLQLVLIHLFDRGIPFSFLTGFVDGILMSALDGIYAFLWFTCPLRLYTYMKKVGWRSLFRRMQHEDQHE